MEFVVYLALILLGLCFGSFAGATVWRLRAYQLKADKKAGEDIDEKEYKQLKKLTKHSVSKDHSVCLHCGYQLRWYDLIPLVSWLSIGGKCRQCRKPIGYFEPLIEVSVAAFFVLSYVLWPYDLTTAIAVAQFVIWLVAGIGLAILFAYDAKWFLLPDKITYSVVALGIVSVILEVVQTGSLYAALNALGAVGILSGLYLVLYIVSKGRWIGFGDIKLGIALGLLLGDWQLAIIALFLANFIGCLVVIPFMIAGKLKRTSYVPFGPLLIVGMVAAQFFGMAIVDWYTFGLF